MSRDEIFQRLDQVCQDVFDDEPITVNEATTAADIAPWDSMEHINLMLAVEMEFGVKFTIGESTNLHNVGELADIIAARATK